MTLFHGYFKKLDRAIKGDFGAQKDRQISNNQNVGHDIYLLLKTRKVMSLKMRNTI